MYKAINGWTKAKMKEQIVKKNNGQKCVKLDGKCSYSINDDSNRCVIGCFIPDNHPALKSDFFASATVMNYDLFNEMPLDSEGLDAFQLHHDYLPSGVFIQDKLFQWIDENVED